MDIVVTGSIAFDYLMHFPGDFMEHVKPERLQKLSLSFLVDDMKRQYGGCAANISFTLALLGECPRLMGAVGQDFDDYRRWLEAHGVNTAAARVIPGVFTASFFATTDQNQNQIASFYSGAMSHAGELSLHELATRPDWVIVSPNATDAMDKYPAECKALGIPYIYDPSQQLVRPDLGKLEDSITGADILIVNDYEFEIVKDRLKISAEEVRRKVKRALIITRG